MSTGPKKNHSLLGRTPQVIFEAMENLRDQYPLRVMLNIFGVSKSGYFEWRSKKTNRENREMDEAKKIRVIEAIHMGSNSNYGSPRVADRMRGLGHDLSTSSVARLMRKYDIKSRLKRKFKATTDSNHKLPVAPNHLMQDFTAYGPNQIWMSDITYIPTKEGWLYIAGVLDLYARKIVGWTRGSRMTKELVESAYLKARAARKPGKHLIFHSDRGSQYASHTFTKLLRKHGVIQSMSRRANCWDSAPIESFWARLKTECTFWYQFSTRQEALQVIHQWIEYEYNVHRAHSANDYAAPNEVETNFRLASQAAKM